MQEGNKFLLGHHHDGTWETFGGGLDFGEEPREALRREIFEELGCDTPFISEDPIMILPHIVHNEREMDWFYNLPIYYKVKIDLSKFDASLQYSEIKWFAIDEIQDLNLFEGEEGIREGFKRLVC